MLKQTACLSIALVCLAALLLVLPFGATAASASAEIATVGLAYEQLNNCEKLVYLYLCEQIASVANGTLASATFTVDADQLALWASQGLKNTWTQADMGGENLTQGRVSDLFWAQFSFQKITRALVHDCPETLYWYDKTVGASVAYSMQTYRTGDVATKITVNQLTFRFNVIASYRAAGYVQSAPTVDLQKTAAAKSAIDNASAIVAKYASASDYAKLVGYRDEICALVQYNHDAASASYTGGYGDPWQLVYVFDGNDATNVVCEGYAKAFQFLCDLTDFSGDISCYSVSGTMAGGTGAGAHMWNVVVMDDGRSYLVDVTNSDQGSVGQDGGLFLSGVSGSISSGYTFSAGGTSVKYLYASDTLSLWQNGAHLALTNAAYQPPTVVIELPNQLVYDGEPLTAGQTNADIRYYYGGSAELASQFALSHVWHADANGSLGAALSEAPKNAGTYWIVVTATRGTEAYTKQTQVVIAPATPSVSAPTGLNAVYGDTLSQVALPQGFAWKDGSLLVGNAGVNRYAAVYTPADTQNYTAVTLYIDIGVAKKDISGMVPETEQFPTYSGKLLTIEAHLPSLGNVGTAYTVAGNTATDVGVYVLTITGIGNYCGSVTAEWKILPDTAKLEGLTPESVTKDSKAAIEAVKASIKSDAAKAEWADVIALCNDLLAAIEQIEAESTTTEEGTTAPREETDETTQSAKPQNDRYDLPLSGCSLTLSGAALSLILLFSSAALLMQKRRD